MAEDDSWVFVSSSDEAYDSDKIDSDIEAELYSVIHHEGDTATSTNNSSICQSPQVNAVSDSNKTPKKDEIWKRNDLLENETDLCTSFESTEKKDLNGNSSSDEVQIISPSSHTPKRKSHLLDNILQRIQLKSNSPKQSNNKSSRKKQRTNSNENLRKKSGSKLLNRTVDVDTSDSDSIIWTEADESDIKPKTNVDDEEVILSSDSFSSDDSFSPFLGNYSPTPISANSSLPSTSSFTENLNDPWYVNSEDMYRSKRPSSRYHERAVLQCSNCNLKGHTVKFCSVPKAVKCYICGGTHMGSRCKDKLCHRCFRQGHDSRFCSQRSVSICVHCNMRGHSAKHCPDLWRRYHLTTNQRNIVVANPLSQSTPIYCFNCGEKGHYGAQCQAPRADRFSFPTWTSVIAYVHPCDTVQRANEMEMNTKLGGIPVWSPTPNFRPPPQQFMPPYGQPPPQMQTPIYRQLSAQDQMPNYNQPPPQMPMNFQTPTQWPKRKKNNKKKKKNLANNLQSPGTSTKQNNFANNQQTPGSMKKKKNKSGSASQTPGSSTKKKTQTEVYFPRTPNILEKRLQKKIRKQEKKLQKAKIRSENFMLGLRDRLGLFH